MGGAETGGIDSESKDSISALLMLSREVALQAATERANRVVLGFRRQKVFERTFTREIANINGLLGFIHVAEGGFVPDGYYDPHALL